ncbi:hypothetical protein B0T14DRAFT_514151 [Immersiella caudata]|uniref:Uncharacterized protein n=1 Tax=Immersiella caudata TaxID=314043 RepID=A0AA39WVX5_9PEZI|nr:hypothetical protein B0T14DRAFT_514151 [Immersiella caudata]
MTAAAIYASLFYSYSASSNRVQLLFDARLIEPVGRLLRRVGAALCATMLVEVAGSIDSVMGRQGRVWLRRTVFATSAVAGVLALAECAVTGVYLTGPGNVKNGKWALPRLDDRFNGSRLAMILGAVAVAALALGSVLVGAVVWETRSAARKFERLGTVRTLLATATCVFFIVRFWAFAEVSLLLAPRRQETKSLAWFYILDNILDRAPMYAVVVLIYYIGVRQKQGLWSWTRVEG